MFPRDDHIHAPSKLLQGFLGQRHDDVSVVIDALPHAEAPASLDKGNGPAPEQIVVAGPVGRLKDEHILGALGCQKENSCSAPLNDGVRRYRGPQHKTGNLLR